MEFNDNYPSYETMAHHDEETGKKKRRKLWNVFWVMLAITLVELFVGFKAAEWHIKGTAFLKIFFIFFTILKAYYIVYAFMHLGDENKVFKWVIIGPYSVFALYLTYLTAVNEGSYSYERDFMIDPMVEMQRNQEKAGGAHHEGGENVQQKDGEQQSGKAH